MAMPLIGLGTWRLIGDECVRVVRHAIEIGYRHIDTAHMYQNHEVIGKAIDEISRAELYITSKFTCDQLDLQDVENSVRATCSLALESLKTDYLDLYLIHWPDRHLPLGRVILAMYHLVKEGLARQIGVSNFNQHHLEDLKPYLHYLSYNQVEFHPYLFQASLLDYCQLHSLRLVSYRPFGKGTLLSDPALAEVGNKISKTPAQVILRWLYQRGIPAIPKASSAEHLRENLDIFDFELSKEHMKVVDQLNRGQRFCQADHPEFRY